MGVSVFCDTCVDSKHWAVCTFHPPSEQPLNGSSFVHTIASSIARVLYHVKHSVNVMGIVIPCVCPPLTSGAQTLAAH